MMRSIIKPSHRATHCCAFSVRILLKILIHKQKRAESPMVSLAQGNTLRKSALQSKILVNDYIYGGRVVDYFWPQAIFLLKISSKISCRRQLKIHGSHGEHGKTFQLQIIIKILFKISSISDAIPNKSLHKARYSSAFCLGFSFKDFGLQAVELFLATGHILLKISSKDFLRSRNQKNIRLTSV